MTQLKTYYDSQVKLKKESQRVSNSQVFFAIELALSCLLAKEVESALLAFSILNPVVSTFLCRSPGLLLDSLHSRTS